MVCYLCEKEPRETYFGYLCVKCRRIKHLLNLYENDVYETLEKVLVRDKKQQEHKIKTIDAEKVKITVEDEKNEYYLRKDNKKRLKNGCIE
jgi:hypothetical protein